VIGSHFPGIGLGTAVVSSHLQHPLVLAARALTVQAATGNLLTLGIGSGRQHTVETVYGIAYDGSAPRLREYLEALMPATRPQAHGASRNQLRRTERGAQHSRREPSGSRPRHARTCHAQARRELG
jgi:alkanesulfonate monooxygenase SsuD/methylene tetrahydromethanopterin reductase-like flavin-dependent oxidoreductase (luciferase family)